MIPIKSKYEIDQMITAGKIVGEVLEMFKEKIIPGISTKALDKLAESYIIRNGALPSFKGVPGFSGAIDFPASICASVNDQVIHGIPDDTILNEGDIISIDVGACYNGYHGDAARTYMVGACSEKASRLIAFTQDSFFKGLEMVRPGNRVIDVSGAIQDHVEKGGYSLVREFTGHGVGRELHEEPEIPNYRTKFKGPRLQNGMALAIEPMVIDGERYIYVDSDNKWTVYTEDGSLAAHYENTVIVNDDEPIITTLICN